MRVQRSLGEKPFSDLQVPFSGFPYPLPSWTFSRERPRDSLVWCVGLTVASCCPIVVGEVVRVVVLMLGVVLGMLPMGVGSGFSVVLRDVVCNSGGAGGQSSVIQRSRSQGAGRTAHGLSM